MKTKTCPKCKETKDVGEFSKNKSAKDGLQNYCKSCWNSYRKANKKRIDERQKAYYKENKDKKKAYYEANKDRAKAYYEANKDKIKAYYETYGKAYYKANKDKKKAYQEANREKILARKKYKYNNDFLYKLKDVYRKSVRKAFTSIGKKKNCNSIKVLGLETWQELEEYLSDQFYDHPVTGEKMTFDNHGYGKDCWQIDHVVPLLTAETEEDVIRLSHYTNLQPLWEVDHLKKTASDFKQYKNS